MFSAMLTMVLLPLWPLIHGEPAADNDVALDRARTVSFTLEHGRVIVPTRVNGSPPLRLILDTGMRFDGVYLFRKDLAQLIDTTGAVEVRVPGAGSGEPSTAIMIETGRLEFGSVTVDSQRVIVSDSPYTQGFRTDGVIGWNLFGHYVIEIDYDAGIITLHDTSGFVADTTWQIAPVTMVNDLPFLDGVLETVNGEEVPVTLYIDLASDEALELLTGPDQTYSMPDDLVAQYLGTGLSGDIYGYRGRIIRLSVARFDLFDIPTAFAPAAVRSKQGGADGILGNGYVRRFNIIFDYTRRRLLLQPSRYFAVPFD